MGLQWQTATDLVLPRTFAQDGTDGQLGAGGAASGQGKVDV